MHLTGAQGAGGATGNCQALHVPGMSLAAVKSPLDPAPTSAYHKSLGGGHRHANVVLSVEDQGGAVSSKAAVELCVAAQHH